MATIKIVLGKRPESIHRIVKVPLPEGKTGTIEVDFKYRTRREFAQFVDAMVEQAKADAGADEQFTTHALADATVRANAKYLGDAIVGWNLDAELGEESLIQLCDELPGVCQALMDAYRTALTEGALGKLAEAGRIAFDGEISDLFDADDYDPVEVWPECWPAWQLFCELSGQWRIAPSGAVMALDYGPLFARMERLRLSDDDWDELFGFVTVIESAAVKAINAKHKQ